LLNEGSLAEMTLRWLLTITYKGYKKEGLQSRIVTASLLIKNYPDHH